MPDFVSARIALRSDVSEIARLNLWLKDLQTDFGLGRAVMERLKLCLNEVAANIITHGYPEALTDGAFEIDLSREADRLVVRVWDDAQPFDPTQAEHAKPITGLEDVQIGGFGIKLIREHSDLMTYRREGSRNLLCLEFIGLDV